MHRFSSQFRRKTILATIFGILFTVLLLPDAQSHHPFISSQDNNFFGTKARYHAPPSDSKLDDVPDTCQLVHFHLLVRHGTRNPRAHDIREFQKFERKLQRNKRSHWPQWLINWRNPYVKHEANALVAQGWRELTELAERDVERYKRWLGDTPRTRHESTWYASSESAQTVKSAQAYGTVFSGITLSNSSLHVIPKKYDREISISDACPRWLQLAHDKSPAKKRISLWSHSGVEGLVLTDLKMTLSDISKMQTAAQSRNPRIKSHIRFGHVGTITIVLTQLGMYEEMPDLHNPNRQFRMSRISPFAANLRFELLRCHSQQELTVRTLLNEVPIRIVGCPTDSDLCSWPIFASLLKNRIGNWDYDELCKATSD
ncbi:histidine phosphatase superfamily [Syncephalis plumigaleata]|nr:histidine phosphatase superfamily [Syncephalis plumigaleata]